MTLRWPATGGAGRANLIARAPREAPDEAKRGGLAGTALPRLPDRDRHGRHLPRHPVPRSEDQRAGPAPALEPGCADLPVDDVGSAVRGILSSVATISRVKERAAAYDQETVMDLIDSEVAAARADRP